MSKTTTETNEKPQGSILTASVSEWQVIEHLSRYPAITSLYSRISSLPGAKSLASAADSALNAAHKRTAPLIDPLVARASPVLKQVDNLGDRALNELDARLPSLQSVQPSDVVTSVQSRIDAARENANDKIDSARSSAQNAYEERLGRPLQSASRAVSERVVEPVTNAVNSHVVEPGTRAVTDVVNKSIAPVNRYIQEFIKVYLPSKTGKIPSGKNEPHELSRTFTLLKEAGHRVRTRVAESQNQLVSYVRKVYDKKLKETTGQTQQKEYSDTIAPQSNPGFVDSARAALSTCQVLIVEALSSLQSYIISQPPAQRAAADAETLVKKASNVVDEVKKASGSAIASSKRKVKELANAGEKKLNSESQKLRSPSKTSFTNDVRAAEEELRSSVAEIQAATHSTS